MGARLLVDAGRVRRQLVVEPIEQDALAPCDQALDIRSAEVEVPDLGIGQLLVPGAQARQRRIHHDPA